MPASRVIRDAFAHAQLADGIVLAKDAARGTVGEKDRAGALRSANGRLLTLVDIPARHLRQPCATAEPLLALEPVDATRPRA